MRKLFYFIYNASSGIVNNSSRVDFGLGKVLTKGRSDVGVD